MLIRTPVKALCINWFYLYHRWSDDDPYAEHSVPSKVKAFNLMPGVNETRLIVQQELWECKYGLNESVRNSKQNWNPDECRCECKELDD